MSTRAAMLTLSAMTVACQADPAPLPPACASTEADDTLADRLCEETDLDTAPDPINITCELETGCYAGPEIPASQLVVVTYNLERGFELDAEIAFLEELAPDVVLVQEADRGCSRTGGRHVVAELAAALRMDYVYGVEYVELPRPEGIDANCEHGNAILSRFPITNPGVIRFETNEFLQPDEPRIGGRMATYADLRIGERTLRVYSTHLESDPLADDRVRGPQAVELAEHALASGLPVVVGGDFNTFYYRFQLQAGDELTVLPVTAFLDRGFVDSHIDLPPEERTTGGGGLIIIDLLFTNLPVTNPSLCDLATCPYSDHAPVWATFTLP